MLQSMVRSNRLSIVRLALLMIGLAGLAWATIFPTNQCEKLSAYYGVCSDNSALKLELAIIGAILIAVAALSHWIGKRRQARRLSVG
jgi:hypothetical protein